MPLETVKWYRIDVNTTDIQLSVKGPMFKSLITYITFNTLGVIATSNLTSGIYLQHELCL